MAVAFGTPSASVHASTPVTYEEDGLGRLRRVVWLEGIRQVPTSYSYDALGNLVRIEDAEGRVRTYRYDGRSRLRESVDPNTGTWTRSYTDGNDLERRTDATGRVVRSVHDALGRLTEEWHQHPGEAEVLSVRVHYDAPCEAHPELAFTRAKPACIEDDAGMLFFGYDARGRMTDRVRRLEGGVEHGTWTDFDAMDRPTRRGFPDATHLTFGYDGRGLLNRIGDLVLDVSYTAWGAAETLEYGNGVVDERAFEPAPPVLVLSAARRELFVLAGGEARAIDLTLGERRFLGTGDRPLGRVLAATYDVLRDRLLVLDEVTGRHGRRRVRLVELDPNGDAPEVLARWHRGASTTRFALTAARDGQLYLVASGERGQHALVSLSLDDWHGVRLTGLRIDDGVLASTRAYASDAAISYVVARAGGVEVVNAEPNRRRWRGRAPSDWCF